MTPLTIEVLAPGSVNDPELSYVLMGASYQGRWIFVRHRERKTWEMPAGHIEKGESSDRAAERELYEEAGVIRAKFTVISDYCVIENGRHGYGRLYQAEVWEMGALPEYEIAEIILRTELPSSLTYPEVQTRLFSLLSLR